MIVKTLLHGTEVLLFHQWPRNWCQDVLAWLSLRGIRAADSATKGHGSEEDDASLLYLPVSLATILAICARSLLSSSCSAVVRLSAVTPGFFRPSIRLPSRRKLGTEEFLWSTRRGVGLHSCFRGRVSLLKKLQIEFLGVVPRHTEQWPTIKVLVSYRTLAYVSSSSATIQAMSAKVGTIGPSDGRRGPRPGSSYLKREKY